MVGREDAEEDKRVFFLMDFEPKTNKITIMRTYIPVYIVLCILNVYEPWHRGPTHWPDTHFILQILDGASASTEDEDTTEADPLSEGDGKCAGNLTSDSVEKSGDMPDRGTTLVPFRVRPGEGQPPPSTKIRQKKITN